MVLAKRGQERSKLTLVISILVVLAVIVLAVFFFRGSFSKSSSQSETIPPKNLPPSLQTAIANCQAAAQIDSIPQYCRTLREIVVDGEAIYADCEENIIEGNFAPGMKQLECGTSKFTDQQIKLFCEGNNLAPSTIVVGKTCQSVGAV